jgi:hypothetical protein
MLTLNYKGEYLLKFLLDISIVELCIYGFLEIFSLSMLIISTIKEIPNTKASSIIRSIYLVPGMIAAAWLARTGQNVTFNTILTNSTTTVSNSSTIWTEVTNQSNFIVLQSEVWGYFHLLIMLVLFAFIINQIVNFMTKPE